MSLTLLTSMVVHLSLFGVDIGCVVCLVCKGSVTHEGHETNSGDVGQKHTPARSLPAIGEGFDEEHDGYVQAANCDQGKRN